MKNAVRLVLSSTLDDLTYQTAYIEYPIPNILQSLKWKNILNKPPANSSKKTLKELEILNRITLKRSEEDIRLIHAIDTDIDSFFIALLSKYNIEYPQKYINEFYSIVKPVLTNTKSFWNRPRPYQLAKYYNIPLDIIVTDTHDTASYPSGHTVYSKLVANILQNLFPQISSAELDGIVHKTGMARVKQGVHYPSDNEASIIFSNHLFKILQPKLRN